MNNDGKPNCQYATFNSRSDKLRSSFLTQKAFKTSRCIIPASGLVEGQNKKYHLVSGSACALALGGLYKSYEINGEVATATSVITSQGNPKWADFMPDSHH